MYKPIWHTIGLYGVNFQSHGVLDSFRSIAKSYDRAVVTILGHKYLNPLTKDVLIGYQAGMEDVLDTICQAIKSRTTNNFCDATIYFDVSGIDKDVVAKLEGRTKGFVWPDFKHDTKRNTFNASCRSKMRADELLEWIDRFKMTMITNTRS